VYAEASAVASVAAVRQLKRTGEITDNDTVVVISTSSGLKDPRVTADLLSEIPHIQPNVDSLKRALSDVYDYTIP